MRERADKQEKVPAFALEAVVEREQYIQDFQKALRAIPLALGLGQKVRIQELVEKVGCEQQVSQVVVQTALSRLLRGKKVRTLRADWLVLG